MGSQPAHIPCPDDKVQQAVTKMEQITVKDPLVAPAWRQRTTAEAAKVISGQTQVKQPIYHDHLDLF